NGSGDEYGCARKTSKGSACQSRLPNMRSYRTHDEKVHQCGKGSDVRLRYANADDRSAYDGDRGGDDVNERHYTVEEIGKSWNLSKDTIRRIFIAEEGVL